MASAIAGMFASSVGKTLLHPIDTVKAKLQVNYIEKPSIQATIKTTIKNDGIFGLYRGLPICVIGGIPAAALYFGSYEFFKTHTLKNEWL